jgi:lysophospholipase L1-like esterase
MPLTEYIHTDGAKKLLLVLLMLIVAYTVFEVIRIRALIGRSKGLVAKSQPYQQSSIEPKYRVLFLGDSTGVGTGVSTPNKSLAGLLGEEHPNAEITNLSKNGLRSDQLANSLHELPEGKFHLTVIHIGGNDLIRFRDRSGIVKNIESTLGELTKKSDRVALYTTGDLGEARLFPIVLRPVYSSSSRHLRDEMKKLVTDYDNVVYIDLFEHRSLNSVSGYAPDGLHLNDAGYMLWYNALKKAFGSPLL